ncbi:hypothetical protein [Halorussus caseinilyticus]|uniref:Uncharacterized protein n=1 Tax=Halorussus caseinilyticus TaxID=3034025 RepID=A0ABD5WM65_9EURY|nr:hypothetical protein [Halorussus sp. DT72]
MSIHNQFDGDADSIKREIQTTYDSGGTDTETTAEIYSIVTSCAKL